ncbi:MAG: metallophosphoesterase family protein [Candidatus Aenigmarchaeota archaeon]|nr:metallophosphoesterase family protein [Candidatus Aenigmarchaeota archaeon]
MSDKIIVFGDIHLCYQALNVILEEADKLGIDFAINLGDEDSIFGTRRGDEHDLIFGRLRDYRDLRSERRLICVVGNETGGVKPYLLQNYVGVDERGRVIGDSIFREGNIIAAHHGTGILQRYGELIRGYNGPEPLVIFHGHSHSMGVLSEYKWLCSDEFVFHLEDGEQRHNLQCGKVYWVNPGRQIGFLRANIGAANFAIYDSQNSEILLRTILYDN